MDKFYHDIKTVESYLPCALRGGVVRHCIHLGNVGPCRLAEVDIGKRWLEQFKMLPHS